MRAGANTHKHTHYESGILTDTRVTPTLEGNTFWIITTTLPLPLSPHISPFFLPLFFIPPFFPHISLSLTFFYVFSSSLFSYLPSSFLSFPSWLSFLISLFPFPTSSFLSLYFFPFFPCLSSFTIYLPFTLSSSLSFPLFFFPSSSLLPILPISAISSLYQHFSFFFFSLLFPSTSSLL